MNLIARWIHHPFLGRTKVYVTIYDCYGSQHHSHAPFRVRRLGPGGLAANDMSALVSRHATLAPTLERERQFARTVAQPHPLSLLSPLALVSLSHGRQRELEMMPGMTFTIEPIFTEGAEATTTWPDAWTVQTVDGGRAAQFEHVVLITEDGHEVLTVPSKERQP